MLSIGVVCEGQTDFVAMKVFLEAELVGHQKVIQLSIIQPALDNSLPSGWSSVLYWLENNDLEYRSSLYSKSAALFEVEDQDNKFDALLFQIDSDILGEAGFESFIAKRGISYVASKTNIERGDAIRQVLLALAGHKSDEDALGRNEIATPIVESSEAWLIAAENITPNAETLIGQPLIDAFGSLVARATGKVPKATYTNINKKVKTRQTICEAQIKTSSPRGLSHHYDDLVKKISNL